MKTFLYHENGWRMIQAEELPVKPNDLDRGLSNIEHLAYVVGLEQYESEIATLKAKSIPIENILVWKLWACQNILAEVLTSDIGIHEWPGDVEIKFVTENNISIARGRAYREESSSELKQGKKVAILTLPKEQ